MMLPQHKEAINQQLKDTGLKRKPELHEDELQIVMENISLSYARKAIICVTIFDEYTNRDLVGVVVSINTYRQNFKIELDNGYEFVDFAEVIRAIL
ncbi:YolD-like protein [Paenibacillus sp. HGF7]|nr:YolD-like protein [Paenibacillus sp. HGF7]